MNAWTLASLHCPLCGHANEFFSPPPPEPGNMNAPERFQMIFWPLTDQKIIYSCAGCGLSCLMWDFFTIPDDKKPAVAEMLKSFQLPRSDSYTGVPVVARLETAEKVYALTGLSGNALGKFYRAMGFHCQASGDNAKADAARKKALAIARAMAEDPAHAQILKETLIVTAAMLFYTGDFDGATAELHKASAEKVRVQDVDRSKNFGATAYFDALIKDYFALIDVVKQAAGKGGKPEKTDAR